MTAPTVADVDAVRMLLGLPAPVGGNYNLLQSWDVPRQSDFAEHWTVEQRVDTKNGGTYMYCPCAAWRFNKEEPKGCKHTRMTGGIVPNERLASLR